MKIRGRSLIAIMNVWPVKAVLLTLLLGVHSARSEHIEYVNSTLWAGVPDVEVVDDYAYCSFHNGLIILDVSDPSDMQFVSKVFCPGRGEGIDVSGDYVYLANGESGVCIIDVSNPEMPEITVIWDSPAYVMDVYVYNDHLYIADWWRGLHIFNVEDPTNPYWVGGIDTNSSTWGIYVTDGLVYLAEGWEGARIIDATDVSNPTILAYMPECDLAHDIEAYGERLYVGTCDQLFIYDISDPSQPMLLSDGHFGWSYGVEIQEDDYAYLALMSSAMMRIIDIRNPEEPEMVGYWRTPDHAQGLGLCLVDDIIYYAAGNSQETSWVTSKTGVWAIDVSDPANPVELGSYTGNGRPSSIHIDDDYAYVCGTITALTVVDLLDPTNPILVGTGESNNLGEYVFKKGNFTYVTMPYSGFIVFDVSDPREPEFIAEWYHLCTDSRITGNGEYVYCSTVTTFLFSMFPTCRI